MTEADTGAEGEVAPPEEVPVSSKGPSPSLKAKVLRLGLLALVLGGLYVAGSASGLLDAVDLAWIRSRVEAAGPWSVPAYVGIFCGGLMLWIPGMLFMVAGIVIYGPWLGAPLALLGASLAASLQVAALRRVGGDLLLDVKRPLLQRALARLHDHPVRSIALLRLFLMVSPPLNAALATAGVTFRANFLGSLLGVAPAIVLIAVATDWALRLLAGQL